MCIKIRSNFCIILFCLRGPLCELTILVPHTFSSRGENLMELAGYHVSCLWIYHLCKECKILSMHSCFIIFRFHLPPRQHPFWKAISYTPVGEVIFIMLLSWPYHCIKIASPILLLLLTKLAIWSGLHPYFFTQRKGILWKKEFLGW